MAAAAVPLKAGRLNSMLGTIGDDKKSKLIQNSCVMKEDLNIENTLPLKSPRLLIDRFVPDDWKDYLEIEISHEQHLRGAIWTL
jgi:hypothetical protein